MEVMEAWHSIPTLSLHDLSRESFIRQRWVVNFKPIALPPENNP